MATKVMTAEARIQARDMTGQVFAQVGGKLKNLARTADAVNATAGRSVGGMVDRHVGAMQRLAGAAEKIGPVVAAGAAIGVKRFAEAAFETYRDFDKLRRYQKAILGLSDEQQKPLIDQAIKMGGSTRFNDIQVLQAQLDLAQRGIKSDVIAPITEAAASFATAMGTDLPEAAKVLEGILFSTGKNVHSGAEAIATANRVASFATKLSKIGGMDAEDIKQFFKYGGQPGSVAGLSDQTMGAMGALMRRSNIRGDEAGVATRAISGKLVAPTSKGIAAMSAMGVDYNKYTRMPGGLSVGALEGSFKRDFGKGFSPAVRKKIDAIVGDPELVSDRGKFTEAVTEAVSSLFEKNKKGGMKATDRHHVAKSVGDFHKYSSEGVDTEGLLRDLIARHPTLAQSNAIFGQQQGGRFLAVVSHGLEMFNEYVQKLKDAGDDFHTKIAAQRNEGFDAAVLRFEGAVKNLETAFGRANDLWMTKGMEQLGELVQHFAEADPSVVRFTTAIGGAVTAIATFETALAAFGIMQRMSGGGNGLLGLGGGFLARMGLVGRGGLVGLLGYLGYQFMETASPPAVKKDTEDRGKDSEAGLRAKLDQIDLKIGQLQAQKGNPGDIATLRSDQMDIQARLAGIEKAKKDSADLSVMLAKQTGLFGQLESFLQNKGDQKVDVTGKITATVDKPVDVTGKVEAELKGSAEVNVKVSVEGPGKVSGMGASSQGPLKVNVGATMPGAGKGN